MKHIKLIATIGDKSFNSEILNKLKDRGVNIFRINLSHTFEEEIEEKIIELKKYGDVAIDTEGSQIRTGNLTELEFKEGEYVKLHNKKIECNNQNIHLNPPYVINYLKPGTLLFLGFDGITLKISDVKINEGYANAIVLIGGKIGPKKAVDIDYNLKLPVFSDKDKKAIELAKKHNIKYFSLSFIKTKEDVLKFKELYPESFVFSKIERKEALENFKEIAEVSDALLIDRGDLSKDVPIEKVPLIQKYLLDESKKLGKDVFIATNTLETMSNSLKPNQAELNDIFTNIINGVSGFVLTRETAIGKYPIETINRLNAIIKNAYSFIEKKEIIDNNHSGLLIPPHGGKLVNRVTNISSEDLFNMKKIKIDEMILMDVEQIAVGAFSPLEGFLSREDFKSVLDNMRLKDGTIWPIPIILPVNLEIATTLNIGEKVALVYEDDGEIYATMEIKDIYKYDKQETVKKWFGTDDKNHPGVNLIFNYSDYLIGGKINLIKRKPSKHKLHELTPYQTRRIFSERGWSKIVGFHTRNVVHRAHEFIQLESMRKSNADGLFIHPIIGKKKKGDFETDIIVKSYEIMNNFYPKRKFVFSVFSTFSRYAGPREALFTALVRKNFGCSHFVVGRDHTGVGDFYSPEASHNIFNKFPKEEIGIIPIKFNEVFYSPQKNDYIHKSNISNLPKEERLHLSGTQIREIFRKGCSPPKWFMRPEISKMILEEIKSGKPVFVGINNLLENDLKDKQSGINNKAFTLWLTGLSGSGKTTITNEIIQKLRHEKRKVEIIDGDFIRENLNSDLGFSDEDIIKNNEKIIFLCKLLNKNGIITLVSVITPFESIRQKARNEINNYFEIFVNCPLEECIKKDVKELYKKAIDNQIKDFIGIHKPYEEPKNPDLILNTNKETIGESTTKLISFLKDKNLI